VRSAAGRPPQFVLTIIASAETSDALLFGSRYIVEARNHGILFPMESSAQAGIGDSVPFSGAWFPAYLAYTGRWWGLTIPRCCPALPLN
jgi:hypothetical protein